VTISTARAAAPVRSVRPAARKPAGRVIGQAFFRHLLMVERRRSERSNQAFALLLVEGPGSLGSAVSPVPGTVLEALAAAKRETDILGWFERPGAVGLILPELAPRDVAAACAVIADRVRREIFRRLPAEAADQLVVTVHVYPESTRGDQGGLWLVDTVLHPDLPASRPGRRLSDTVKRGIDIAASLVLLLLLAPLFGLIAALVKLTSRGPVLFRQVRVGQMVKPFTMLKFRPCT
jgi:hypothetical protein